MIDECWRWHSLPIKGFHQRVIEDGWHILALRMFHLPSRGYDAREVDQSCNHRAAIAFVPYLRNGYWVWCVQIFWILSLVTFCLQVRVNWKYGMGRRQLSGSSDVAWRGRRPSSIKNEANKQVMSITERNKNEVLDQTLLGFLDLTTSTANFFGLAIQVEHNGKTPMAQRLDTQ